ncbi:hypothetical protein PD280_07320 [Virgibacillus salarius]|uniref:hypothetical protein n=1 Tax=Virgibacillus salarius TaxID=447199 RepID=UPI0024918BB1|nr:hypothetical protein [Virgibacillus salarius]WBX81501.1 hypothetical protein PD280_07320 [Virgibacillus salarius]
MNAHQVSVAAESFTAALFAWSGFDISVQYGANQPEYDLVVVNGSQMLKVSVKGSQDGAWGLSQGYKKGRSYHDAAEMWVEKHTKKTIVCLVQFKGVDIRKGELPRVYIATPEEIGKKLKASRNGHGETILKENHTWTRGVGKGYSENIPEEWRFSKERLNYLLKWKS